MSFLNNKFHSLTTLLKGLIVGGTMLVPGVSGGSMAIILGIYDKLISSISSIKKNFKSNLLFLLTFSIGGIWGMLIFAKPILSLIETYPMPTLYFFLGAVVGGIPFIINQANFTKFTYKQALCISFGTIIVITLTNIPINGLNIGSTTSFKDFIILIIAGIIAAVALVLPGISVSYLLLVMGLYDPTMNAISTFNLSFLAPLGLGVLLGILLTTKTLEYAMSHYTTTTYLIILGFVLGSIYELFPGIPSGSELLLCVISGLCGYLFISYISNLE